MNLSAYFILAANSFMQHPVGVRFNPETGRAELRQHLAMLTNVTALATFPHVIAGAWLVAGGFVLAVSAWHLAAPGRQGRHGRDVPAGLPASRWWRCWSPASPSSCPATGRARSWWTSSR